MASKALEAAFQKTIRDAVSSEVTQQLAGLRLEIARVHRALESGNRRSSGTAKAGPKIGNRTAASERLTPKSIKAVRKKLGLSQADFATLAGVTPVAVYFWESGRTKPRGTSVDALVELRAMSPAKAKKRLGR